MMFSEAERAAVTGLLDRGDRGARALRRFLDVVDFERAGGGLWRMAPLLHRRAVEHAIDHPLVARLRGVARHIWVGNEFRIRSLPSLLDLAAPITPVVLIHAMATLVRLGEQVDLRPMGHFEVLASPTCAYTAVRKLQAAGWQAPLTDKDVTNESWHVVPLSRDAIGHALVFRRLPYDVPHPDFEQDVIACAHSLPFRGDWVMVPSREDHLLMLLLQVGAPGEPRIDLALEAALNLSADAHAVDWTRFQRVTDAHDLTPRIRMVAAMLRGELGIAVPKDLDFGG
jgi:hypothetical protein